MNLPTKYRHNRRRGLATLEFAMSLPILLLLVVGIVWLGFAVAGQSQVTVEARNNAWRLRHGGSADTPQSGKVAGEQPFVFLSNASITEKADATVKVSPIYDSWSQPKSAHTVLGGSWDFTSIDLNGPPNWSMYARVAVSAKTGGLQGALTDVEVLMGGLDQATQGLINDAVKGALEDAAGDALSNAGNIFDSL
jgi:hypothetical protein